MTGEVTHPPMLIVSCVAPLDLVRVVQLCMPCVWIFIASLYDATAYDTC